GNAVMNVQGVPIIVDSNAPDAVTGVGSSQIIASELDVTGNPGVSGAVSISGQVISNSPPVPDPLAYLPEPDPSQMQVQSQHGINWSNGSHTIQPGIYRGMAFFQQRSSDNNMNISGNGNASMSGTFYTQHGTLNVTGNGASDTIGSQYISYKLVVNGNGNFKVNWDVNLTGKIRII